MRRTLTLLLTLVMTVSVMVLGVAADEVTTAEVSSLSELQSAIESGTDEITVTKTIEISDTVEINGNGCNVIRSSALTSGAVFNVTSSGNLTLTNVTVDGNNVTASAALVANAGSFTLSETATLTNGSSTANSTSGGLQNKGAAVIYGEISNCSGKGGGAIHNDNASGSLVIESTALFDNNSSTGNGGAIYHKGVLTVNGGTFSNNHTSNSYSGAIHLADGSASIKNATFKNNYITKSAASGSGGGVMYISGSKTATIENVTVIGNTDSDGNTTSVAVEGGAFRVGSKATLTIKGTNNVFQNLQATNGGVIYNNGGTVTIAGGTFTSNVASTNGGVIYNASGTTTINGGTYQENSANAGGAIYVLNGTASVDSAAFESNSCSTSGGVFHAPAEDSTTVSISATNCTFTTNTAGTYGGVINTGNGCEISFENCSFTQNTAKKSNNSNTLMLSTSAIISLKNVTITPNDESVGDVRLQNKATLNLAGMCDLGIVYYNTNANVINLSEALSTGSNLTIIPAAYTEGDAVVTQSSDGLLSDAGKYIAVADNGGEKWAVDTTTGKLVKTYAFAAVNMTTSTSYTTLEEAVTNATDGDTIQITNDYTVNAVIEIDKSLTITSDTGNVHTLFRGSASDAIFNVTAAGDLTLDSIVIDGDKDNITADAALILNAGTFTLGENATLTNAVSSTTAGVALNNSNKETAKAYIKGTISNCTTCADGGGVVRNYPNATMEIADSAKFLNNYGLKNGGALYSNGKLTVGTALFEGNHSDSSGGAIAINAGTASFTGTKFVGNTAVANGGSITTKVSFTMDSVSFEGASEDGVAKVLAAKGGAVYVDSDCTLTLTSSTFTSLAANNGGAIYNNGGTITITSGTFTGNTVIAPDVEIPEGEESTPAEKEPADGGVIYNSAGNVTIKDGTFTDNSAETTAGVLCNNKGTVTVEGGTYSGNTSNGGGGGVFVNTAGTLDISGGEFTGNTAKTGGGVINTSGTAVVKISSGTFTGNAAGTNGGAIHISGSGTLNLSGGTITGNSDQNDPDVDIWLNNYTTSSLSVTSSPTYGNVGGMVSCNYTINGMKQDCHYEAVVTAPTCTEAGYITYTCPTCGDTYTADGAPAAHTWNDGEVTTEATFTDKGVMTYTCTVEGCGKTKTEDIPVKVAVAMIGDVQYESVKSAVEAAVAAEEAVVVKLAANSEEVITVNDGQTLYLDLNGYDLEKVIVINGDQETGGKFYGMDTTTDDYICGEDDYGMIGSIEGTYETAYRTTVTGTGKRYVSVAEGENNTTVSFHRFYVGITHMALRPAAGGAGYTMTIAGDEKVQSILAESDAYGYTVSVEINGKTASATRDGGKADFTDEDKDGIQKMEALTIDNILVAKDAEGYELNATFADIKINVSAFIQFNGMDKIEVTTTSLSFKEIVEATDDALVAGNLSDAQKEALICMYNDLGVGAMGWDIPNIKALAEAKA